MGRDRTARGEYRGRLAALTGPDREAYLLAESRLPGPRANLELLAVAVDEASPEELRRWAALTPEAAPPNAPAEFLAIVGAAGLGRLVAAGDRDALARLRRLASDPRWRVREGVAMALQRIGKQDLPDLVRIAGEWARGSRYDQRAAVAGLAEPLLLRGISIEGPLDVFDTIMASVEAAADGKSEAFEVLAKALGYGWSVLVAADPERGKPRMERWLRSRDPIVRRIMRENLSKSRLKRVDPKWTARWGERLA
jgi:HEAT repeat protein